MNLQDYHFTINPAGLSDTAAQETYRQQVTEKLEALNRTTVGNILLRSIRFHRLTVEVRPYVAGDCAAEGGGERAAGVVRGFVEYSPDTFSLHGACSSTPRPPQWDQVLFHELVHVFRNVSNRWMQSPLVGGLYRYDDKEEFIAVLLEDIYVSERSNTSKGLRADHRDNRPLEPLLSQPFGFFSSGCQTFSLIRDFVTENPGITAMLAKVKSPFNPIADYFADPARAEALSNKALPRDVVGVLLQIMGI